MAYKIYSVESRKGGLGKTTIALNLSKALIDKRYDVLLIDCDITGTSVIEVAGALSFWHSPITDKDFKMSNHGSEEVATGTLNAILKAAGLK